MDSQQTRQRHRQDHTLRRENQTPHGEIVRARTHRHTARADSTSKPSPRHPSNARNPLWGKSERNSSSTQSDISRSSGSVHGKSKFGQTCAFDSRSSKSSSCGLQNQTSSLNNRCKRRVHDVHRSSRGKGVLELVASGREDKVADENFSSHVLTM